jgi:hypothetical protein
MSGESERSHDDELFEDDFVVEDLAGKNDELDSLFDEATAAGSATAGAENAAPADDEEEALFVDHTNSLEGEQAFEPRPGFGEDQESTWNGELLDLGDDDAGITPEAVELSIEGIDEPTMAAAKDAFEEELGNLLRTDDTFAAEETTELELVEGVTGELDSSVPFVLDEGEGLLDEVVAEDGAPLTERTDDEQVPFLHEESFVGGVEGVDPGWEPLPAPRMDELSDVPVDESLEATVPAGEGWHEVSLGATEDQPALAASSGPDGEAWETADDESVVAIAVAPPRRGRVLTMLVSLAAVVLVLVGGATVLMRPEWFGIAFEPERVERAQIVRPVVVVEVPEPAAPPVMAVVTPEAPSPAPSMAAASGHEPVAPVATNAPPTSGGETNGRQIPDAPPTPPAVATPTVGGEPAVAQVAGAPALPQVVPPVAAAPETVSSWPIAVAAPPVAPPTSTGAPAPRLVRIGENLLVGSAARETAPRAVQAVNSVIPGSRAFAQLQNGNYFVGSVKCIGESSITLRVDTGEVTLAVADIEHLTELDSANYNELQKATTGFVRLTNNNRLVGGILSRIADDHVVLEFRSNRVMLPKSAVGKIVSGDGDSGVRLETTSEEDAWLRRIAERQLGGPASPSASQRPTGQPPR